MSANVQKKINVSFLITTLQLQHYIKKTTCYNIWSHTKTKKTFDA